MMRRTRLKRIVGVNNGRVTNRKRCQVPAPSRDAASSSSAGTFCNPARKMIMVPPTLHRLIRIRVGSAHCVLASQPGPGIPTEDNRELTRPNGGLKIHKKRTATATPDATDGR